MSIDVAGVNWLAVGTAALVTFMLGGAWYTALFGKLWVRLHGYSEEQVRAMQARRPPAVFFGGMIACYFVVALAVAFLAGALGLRSAAGGAVLGLVLWLGPAAALALTGHIASDKPINVYLIDASFQLVTLVFMGVLLAAWR